MLIEGGTHLIFDALISPYRMGEAPRARMLLRSVTQGMLVMWDRGLHSYLMVNGTIKKQAAILGRVPAHVKFTVETVLPDGSYLSYIHPDRKLKKKGFQPILVRVIEYQIDNPQKPENSEFIRVITNLFDTEQFPADLLATEYHQRWEAENTIDEVKTHLNGRKTPIRSWHPREVVQEVYGWLLGHWAVRCLMFQSATLEGISPLRLSFTASLKVIRRAIPHFQTAQPDEYSVFFQELFQKILSEKLPPRENRSNPRVVKKPVSKFKTKKPEHRRPRGKQSLPAIQVRMVA